MLSNMMVHMKDHLGEEINEDYVRHLALNSLRGYRTKFKEEFGELVIACDNKKYWRKNIFPYYKSKRKKNREDSKFNWSEFYACIDKIKQELREYFPYKVIDVESAEADDIIGTLSQTFHSKEKILIVSSDKDFRQLQRFENVKQYNPIESKFMVEKNPELFLKEHIIRGDSGDSIPNFLSEDNCFVIGERQKSITSKKLEEWLKHDPKTFCTDYMLRNYKRNEALIDLTFIPQDIKMAIVYSFNDQENKKAKNLLNYFMANKLKHLTENLQEFV